MKGEKIGNISDKREESKRETQKKRNQEPQESVFGTGNYESRIGVYMQKKQELMDILGNSQTPEEYRVNLAKLEQFDQQWSGGNKNSEKKVDLATEIEEAYARGREIGREILEKSNLRSVQNKVNIDADRPILIEEADQEDIEALKEARGVLKRVHQEDIKHQDQFMPDLIERLKEEDLARYYQKLGLKRGASYDQFKKAYRKLARQYHPDRNPGDKEFEEKFKEVQEAYDYLDREVYSKIIR
jgi:vacuolar-type H+-ATPase subunit I/STV1